MNGKLIRGARTADTSEDAGRTAPPRTAFESDVPESRETDCRTTQPGMDQVETLGAMTDIAIHEINNVLQGLKLTMAVIERDVGAEGLPDHLRASLAPTVRDASTGVEHIADIVRELRDLHRPFVGEPEAFDPAETLRTALKIAGHRVNERARVVEEIWPVPAVRGRKRDLVCVFLNLLLNAAESISEGEPAGHAVTVRAALEPYGAVLFEVEDTGCGVPPEIADHIFEPYVTSRRGKGGSGLGLHVCRRVVREMGGRIGFEPGTNRGTRFWVVLPRSGEGDVGEPAACPDADNPCGSIRDPMPREVVIDPSVPRSALQASTDSPGKQWVLVVDDDAAMRRLLERELSAAFETISVANSSEAMSVLRERGRSLVAIVTDKDLGSGQSGLTILEAARRQGLPCVRILVSGDMHDELEAQLAADGLAHAAFGKPWPPKEVVTCVTDLLNSRDVIRDESAAKRERLT